MHGEFHIVAKDLVNTKFGVETWSKILEASNLNEGQHFLLFHNYPDSETMTLIAAIASVLNLDVATVLRECGQHFLTYWIKHGYDKMLLVLGGDFVTFIRNLDSLHSFASITYHGIKSPTFRVIEEEDGTILLHYYSIRKGLYPILEGLMPRIAEELFGQKATVSLVSMTEEKTVEGKQTHHTILLVDIEDIPGQVPQADWALENKAIFQGHRDSLPAPICLHHLNSAQSLEDAFRGNRGDQLLGTETAIRTEDFCLAFPYHLVMDMKLRLKQYGEDIQRFSRVTIQPGTPFQSVGFIVKPTIPNTLESILHFIHSIFVLAICTKVKNRPLVLKGQMIWMSNCAHLMFMGSPKLETFEDLKKKRLYISDLPLYDVTREIMLHHQRRNTELEITKRLDVTRAKLKVMHLNLAEQKNQCQGLLYETLTPKIARQLLRGHAVRGQKFSECTLLFSDVVSFTDIASICEAKDILNMLNEMYYRFDSHTDQYGIFKVETIGDAYMAVTGVPEIQEDHATRMAEFAMDILDEVSNVKTPTTGLPLKIRMGMHTGPVVGGVVGRKKPRYDLYGPTVNIASRIESTGAPERIHVSNTTFSALYPYSYQFLNRGPISLDEGAQAVMNTFFLVGSSTRKLVQPNDRHSTLISVVNPSPKPSDKFAAGKTVGSVGKVSVVSHDANAVFETSSYKCSQINSSELSTSGAGTPSSVSSHFRRFFPTGNMSPSSPLMDDSSKGRRRGSIFTRFKIGTTKKAENQLILGVKGQPNVNIEEEGDVHFKTNVSSPYFDRHMDHIVQTLAPPKHAVCKSRTCYGQCRICTVQ